MSYSRCSTLTIEYWPVDQIMVLIVYAQQPHLNAYSDTSSLDRGLNFGLSLHLHPYYVCFSIDSSSESVHFRRPPERL